jgi:hypothetical protein
LSIGPRWLGAALVYNFLIIGVIQVLGGVAELGYTLLAAPADRRIEGFIFGVVAVGSGLASLMVGGGLYTLRRG